MSNIIKIAILIFIALILMSASEQLAFLLQKKALLHSKSVEAKIVAVLPPNKVVLSTGEAVHLAGVKFNKAQVSELEDLLLGPVVLRKDTATEGFFVYKNGDLENEHILKKGLATLDDSLPHPSTYKLLQKAQFYAQFNKNGVWYNYNHK